MERVGVTCPVREVPQRDFFDPKAIEMFVLHPIVLEYFQQFHTKAALIDSEFTRELREVQSAHLHDREFQREVEEMARYYQEEMPIERALKSFLVFGVADPQVFGSIVKSPEFISIQVEIFSYWIAFYNNNVANSQVEQDLLAGVRSICRALPEGNLKTELFETLVMFERNIWIEWINVIDEYTKELESDILHEINPRVVPLFIDAYAAMLKLQNESISQEAIYRLFASICGKSFL